MSEKIALNRTLLPGLGCRFSPRNASIIKILLPGCASIRSSLYRRNGFDLPAAASSRLAILFVALSNFCKNSNPLRSTWAEPASQARKQGPVKSNFFGDRLEAAFIPQLL